MCARNAVESWVQEMEPTLTTDPELEGVLAELSRREPIFHRPEFGTTRADFERMTAEDYWETGACGRRYSRQCVLDGLEERFSVPHADVWETRDFHCRRLSEETYLLTYTLLQDHQRLTRRATIWQNTSDGWKIVYHQGTIVQDVEASCYRQNSATSPALPQNPVPRAVHACIRSRAGRPGPGGTARRSGRRHSWRTPPSRCAPESPESARG